MKSASSYRICFPDRPGLIAVVGLGASLLLSTGCGSGSSTTNRKPSGNTNVTLMLTSTANDRLTQFALDLQSLTLTSQSGKTVTLLSSEQPTEFMHLNAGLEPLTVISIPQGVYTSASVAVPGARYICVSQAPGGGMLTAEYSVPTGAPVINLPSPITVTGNTMGLLLNLQVSNSATVPNCYSNPPFQGFTLTPTFQLTPISLSASPTNSENGKVTGLEAIVAALQTTAGSLTLSVAAGPFGTRTLMAKSNASTVFRGINSLSVLVPGMFVNVDGAIESDGSLLISRIEVENPSARNLSTGPILQVASAVPALMIYGRTELGSLLTAPTGQGGIYLDTPNFDFSNAAFSISGQLTNLESLPFVPTFDAASMVAGQNVDITSPAFSSGGTHTPANTVTLVPQTIDGIVQSSATAGSFTIYTVSLASYDLFPQLAVQPGQTTVLSDPNHVQVYVDNNTQQLNSHPLSSGSTVRFYGLVFNDNGTLKMDCAQISDGVAE